MSQKHVKIKCDFIGSWGRSHRRSQDFGSGENTFGVGLLGGPAAAPPDATEFPKIFKNYLKKIAINALLLHIFLKINKPCVIVSRVWTKKQIVGKFSENFEHFDENSIEKLNFLNYFWKMCY